MATCCWERFWRSRSAGSGATGFSQSIQRRFGSRSDGTLRDLICLAAIICFTSGCGDSSPLTYPASGVVLWEDGRPATELAGGGVLMKPLRTARAMALGEIGHDASFVINSYDGRKGAEAGEYQVAVLPEIDMDAADPVPKIIDFAFIDHKTTPLKVVVQEGPNDLTLTVGRFK